MSAPTANIVVSNLDAKHCRAICEEVGERLALILQPTTELPPRLQDLLDRLALLDHDAPSIAPSMEDMIMPEAVFLAYG